MREYRPNMMKQQWDDEDEVKVEEREAVGGGREEEEEVLDVELEDDDCFFEPLDRVPSGVSFDFDNPSSSSDGEDDVRFSFASAVAPPSVSDDDDYDEDEAGGHGYDYGIWMAEPISIKERRHRLLQGMGFTSSKDMPVPTVAAAAGGLGGRSLKLSRSRLSHRILAAAAASSSSPRPILTRSRSDTQVVLRGLAGSALFRRASSAPSSLWDPPWYQSRGGEGGDPIGGGGGEEEGAAGGCGLDSLLTEGVCRIKNLDTGKEFVVSEFRKDGTWSRLNDLQTGLQLTLEEFERFLGTSPIVKELMRRVNLGGSSSSSSSSSGDKKGNNPLGGGGGGGAKSSKSSSSGRRKGGWLKNIKFVASSVTGLILEKDKDCGPMRRSSSPGGRNEWLKVHQHGKSYKELTGLYMCQQIQAHQGCIWCIKFSSDSRYLASAGEDRVVHVWQVLQSDTVSSSSSLLHQDSRSSLPPLPMSNGSPNQSARPSDRARKGKVSSASKRRSIPDYIVMPETIFSLAEKAVCSFEGHLDDVLDLSWSKSQYLLSSSMDKTVRLWDMESKSCLKLFAHNDYVTCIQFNPVDDRYFISGSLDAKVRIWSIPDRQVVDWSDLHEMVTAVCYTPDGQGALVGSHKGSCRFYNASDCKLDQECQMDIRNKKRKSHAKKITGFQFAPGNPSEVLITSADSQIRVFDGVDMIHKFRGFRNTSSQMSASFTLDGRFVVCASEDSHVYVWKRDGGGGKSKGLITTRSHEHFYCKDVSVAIPWPNAESNCRSPSLPSSLSGRHNHHHPNSDSHRSTSTLEDLFPSSRSHCPPPPLPKKSSSEHISPSSEEHRCYPSHRSTSGIGGNSSFVSSSPSLLRSDASSSSSSSSWGWYSGGGSNRITSSSSNSVEVANAWGLVVVTAGLGGDIKIYQNFGLPLRLSRQTNLF